MKMRYFCEPQGDVNGTQVDHNMNCTKMGPRAQNKNKKYFTENIYIKMNNTRPVGTSEFK